MNFVNKNIVLISQQDWGKMFISKHHYAVELAKRGNTVYYLEGPRWSKTISKSEINITETEYENVYVIRHKLPYTSLIKHKFEKIYLSIVGIHIDKILKQIREPIDVVWSFDFSNTLPLSAFPKQMLKLFMPVDEPKKASSIAGAKDANAIFSVTHEILDMYNAYSVPKMFVNHGVSESFICREVSTVNNQPIQVGVSGNFLRPDIDWETLLEIVNSNQDVVFNFYGTIEPKGANLTAMKNLEIHPAIAIAKASNNVAIHGLVRKEELADELMRMDCFLICYDIDKDLSSGTNYHKVLEYMATGKVIVSNNISTYNTRRELVTMPDERNNIKLSELFSDVIKNIALYNSHDKQMVRIKYAKEHTYANNITRIENFVTENVLKEGV